MCEVDSKPFSYPILITGGAGFLGSHMVALCLEKQVDVVVIDNLSNSDLSNLQTLEKHFKKSEYTITNYPKNEKIKSGTIIKNFPENKPKFSLIYNDR